MAISHIQDAQENDLVFFLLFTYFGVFCFMFVLGFVDVIGYAWWVRWKNIKRNELGLRYTPFPFNMFVLGGLYSDQTYRGITDAFFEVNVKSLKVIVNAFLWPFIISIFTIGAICCTINYFVCGCLSIFRFKSKDIGVPLTIPEDITPLTFQKEFINETISDEDTDKDIDEGECSDKSSDDELLFSDKSSDDELVLNK